ncbi:hypothetical protein EV183_003670 [Coemansia sp. RSA 2336]|nr:hypothetical protein EV183_003670 [Coemansia sp. RSA 2336]
MPIDLAADREARRKARYRGKPERARFHRPDADKHFEIAVSQSEALRDRPSDLVHGMRSISIRDSAASGTCGDGSLRPNTNDIDSGLCIEGCSDSAYAATPGSPAESAASGSQPEPANLHTASDLGEGPEPVSIDSDEDPEPISIYSGEEPEPVSIDPDEKPQPAGIDSDEKPQPAGIDSDDQPEPASIDPNEEPEPTDSDKPQTKPQRRGRRTKPKSTRARARKDIDTTGIEQVIEHVPERMTRSMARKLGVQRPRRHFGEGVSTSQILRPPGT